MTVLSEFKSSHFLTLSGLSLCGHYPPWEREITLISARAARALRARAARAVSRFARFVCVLLASLASSACVPRVFRELSKNSPRRSGSRLRTRCEPPSVWCTGRVTEKSKVFGTDPQLYCHHRWYRRPTFVYECTPHTTGAREDRGRIRRSVAVYIGSNLSQTGSIQVPHFGLPLEMNVFVTKRCVGALFGRRDCHFPFRKQLKCRPEFL